MKVGYTEFSYGYAFTENLIRSSSTAPTGAPVFPNLLQEGLSGFDVRINFPGVPLFFQYKLPELMRPIQAPGTDAARNGLRDREVELRGPNASILPNLHDAKRCVSPARTANGA
jgi:hypothetical protein